MKLDSLLWRLKQIADDSESPDVDFEFIQLGVIKVLLEFINNPKVEKAVDDIVM